MLKFMQDANIRPYTRFIPSYETDSMTHWLLISIEFGLHI